MPNPFDSSSRELPFVPFPYGSVVHPHDYQEYAVPYYEALERNRIEAVVLTNAVAKHLAKLRVK